MRSGAEKPRRPSKNRKGARHALTVHRVHRKGPGSATTPTISQALRLQRHAPDWPSRRSPTTSTRRGHTRPRRTSFCSTAAFGEHDALSSQTGLTGRRRERGCLLCARLPVKAHGFAARGRLENKRRPFRRCPEALSLTRSTHVVRRSRFLTAMSLRRRSPVP